MTEKIKHFFDLFDTQPEILAWIFVALAIFFEVRGFDDAATVALLFVSALLMGYIKRVKAGVFEAEGRNG